MTADPTLIADLARAGLDPELLQRVALELARGQAAMAAAAKAEADRAAKAEAVAEAKRAANAERQRRFRDKSNARNALQPVTERYEALPLKRSPTPPKNTPEDITPTLPSEAPAPLPTKPRRFEWPGDFEARFWAAYPRHTDRKKAMIALGRVRRADRVAFEDILAGCERLAASDAEPEFLPHASTWLNNERWTDEVPSRRRQPQSRAGPDRKPSSNGPLSRAADILGVPDGSTASPSSQFDRGPVIDHEGDGRYDREVHEPAGGQAGRFSAQAALRLISSGRH